MGRWAIIGCLIVGLAVATGTPVMAQSPGMSAKERRVLDLADLETLGEFKVTLSGKEVTAHLSEERCLYFELVYGDKGPDGWRSFSMAGGSDRPLTLQTPKGAVELTPNRLRLYLAPSFSKVYTRDQAQTAPEVIREELAGGEGPVTAEVYSLKAGQTYYVKVDRESYWLPPEPGSERPSRHFNRVLMLSSEPFVDGKSPQPLTPRGQMHSY